jgi:hypothetical protein
MPTEARSDTSIRTDHSLPDPPRRSANGPGLDQRALPSDEAVACEHQHREGLTAPLREAETHLLDIRDDENGDVHKVRLHGKQLARDRAFWLYAAEDGSVLVYDNVERCLYGFDDDLPAPVAVIDVEVFRSEPAFYGQIMGALGLDSAIDIGAVRRPAGRNAGAGRR